MSALFQPWSLGGLPLDNRIVVAPMCQYSSPEGVATDWHLMHLGSLAVSGAGLLITEATSVTADGGITALDLALHTDDQEAGLGRVIEGIRSFSAMPIAIQLAHAGRKASTRAPWHGGGALAAEDPGGWQTVAPSALAFGDHPVPRALDEQGLLRIRYGFAQAAVRSGRIGLDGIEIHMAHGYLLHQFLSPLSNLRTDRYGGSLEARLRFPLEVFDAVRAAFPADRPVWVRVSAEDWVEGGWDLEQTIALAQALQARGCAAIHVSSGGLSAAQSIPVGPGYQVPLATRIRAAIELPVIAVGLITTPDQAEQIVVDGHADAVALARAMLYDPRWPWHAAEALGAQVSVPPAYQRGVHPSLCKRGG